MLTSRRHFIQSSLTAGIGVALSPSTVTAASQMKKIPIAFQLYTVRGEFSRDVPGTLKKLAEIGYQAVEFWGYAGTPEVYQKHTAAELRKFLDDSGLKCCGIHMDLKAISKENLDRTIENNKVLDNDLLNVAAAQQKMSSESGITELADLLTQTAVTCKPHHMTVGYHAHPFDFAKFNDRFAWDLLFSRLGPEVNMQMDVGNCLGGNGDPIAMLKKFPGRTRSIHIKEHQEKTFDSEFYKEVFSLCESSGVTRWYIVEMGGDDGNGFDIPREALQKLHRLGK